MSNNISYFHTIVNSNVNFGKKIINTVPGQLYEQRERFKELLAKKPESDSPLNISHEMMDDCFGIKSDTVAHQPDNRLKKPDSNTFKLLKFEK